MDAVSLYQESSTSNCNLIVSFVAMGLSIHPSFEQLAAGSIAGSIMAALCRRVQPEYQMHFRLVSYSSSALCGCIISCTC